MSSSKPTQDPLLFSFREALQKRSHDADSKGDSLIMQDLANAMQRPKPEPGHGDNKHTDHYDQHTDKIVKNKPSLKT